MYRWPGCEHIFEEKFLAGAEFLINALREERENGKQAMASLHQDYLNMLDEHDKWKNEYENLCKFATDFENQRDQLRVENLAFAKALQCNCEALSRGFEIHACFKCNTLNDAPHTAQLAKRWEAMERIIDILQNRVGEFLSAALDDPSCCDEFKQSIRILFKKLGALEEDK